MEWKYYGDGTVTGATAVGTLSTFVVPTEVTTK